jgi:hypothetical protein
MKRGRATLRKRPDYGAQKHSFLQIDKTNFMKEKLNHGEMLRRDICYRHVGCLIKAAFGE